MRDSIVNRINIDEAGRTIVNAFVAESSHSDQQDIKTFNAFKEKINPGLIAASLFPTSKTLKQSVARHEKIHADYCRRNIKMLRDGIAKFSDALSTLQKKTMPEFALVANEYVQYASQLKRYVDSILCQPEAIVQDMHFVLSETFTCLIKILHKTEAGNQQKRMSEKIVEMLYAAFPRYFSCANLYNNIFPQLASHHPIDHAKEVIKKILSGIEKQKAAEKRFELGEIDSVSDVYVAAGRWCVKKEEQGQGQLTAARGCAVSYTHTPYSYYHDPGVSQYYVNCLRKKCFVSIGKKDLKKFSTDLSQVTIRVTPGEDVRDWNIEVKGAHDAAKNFAKNMAATLLKKEPKTYELDMDMGELILKKEDVPQALLERGNDNNNTISSMRKDILLALYGGAQEGVRSAVKEIEQEKESMKPKINGTIRIIMRCDEDVMSVLELVNDALEESQAGNSKDNFYIENVLQLAHEKELVRNDKNSPSNKTKLLYEMFKNAKKIGLGRVRFSTDESWLAEAGSILRGNLSDFFENSEDKNLREIGQHLKNLDRICKEELTFFYQGEQYFVDRVASGDNAPDALLGIALMRAAKRKTQHSIDKEFSNIKNIFDRQENKGLGNILLNAIKEDSKNESAKNFRKGNFIGALYQLWNDKKIKCAVSMKKVMQMAWDADGLTQFFSSSRAKKLEFPYGKTVVELLIELMIDSLKHSEKIEDSRDAQQLQNMLEEIKGILNEKKITESDVKTHLDTFASNIQNIHHAIASADEKTKKNCLGAVKKLGAFLSKANNEEVTIDYILEVVVPNTMIVLRDILSLYLHRDKWTPQLRDIAIQIVDAVMQNFSTYLLNGISSDQNLSGFSAAEKNQLKTKACSEIVEDIIDAIVFGELKYGRDAADILAGENLVVKPMSKRVNDSNKKITLSNLPVEVIEKIGAYLPKKDAGQFSSSSSLMHAVLRPHMLKERFAFDAKHVFTLTNLRTMLDGDPFFRLFSQLESHQLAVFAILAEKIATFPQDERLIAKEEILFAINGKRDGYRTAIEAELEKQIHSAALADEVAKVDDYTTFKTLFTASLALTENSPRSDGQTREARPLIALASRVHKLPPADAQEAMSFIDVRMQSLPPNYQGRFLEQLGEATNNPQAYSVAACKLAILEGESVDVVLKRSGLNRDQMQYELMYFAARTYASGLVRQGVPYKDVVEGLGIKNDGISFMLEGQANGSVATAAVKQGRPASSVGKFYGIKQDRFFYQLEQTLVNGAAGNAVRKGRLSLGAVTKRFGIKNSLNVNSLQSKMPKNSALNNTS